MSLLGLPNELLLQVIKGLDMTTIHSLVLTNRRLSYCLTLILYEFACDRKNFTFALYLAATNGNEEMMKYLIKRGPSTRATPISPKRDPFVIQYHPNKRPKGLSLLTNDEKDNAVKLCLEKGADSLVFQVGFNGNEMTALGMAVSSGDLARAKLLLERGASTTRDHSPWSPLIVDAVRKRHEGIIRLLLDHGEDIECHGWSCSTPLQVAISNGDEGVIRLLLERGADLENAGSIGDPALISAVKNSPPNLVESHIRLLLEMGAGIDGRDSTYGRTALIWAVLKCQPPQRGWLTEREALRHKPKVRAVELLLERGANPNLQDVLGETALHAARGYKLEDLTKRLLDHGADPTTEDDVGPIPYGGLIKTEIPRSAQPITREGLLRHQVSDVPSSLLASCKRNV